MATRAFLIAFLCLLPVLAGADQPAVYLGSVSGPLQTACVLVVPGGAGAPLNQASTPWGALIDATISVTVIDEYLIPVAYFPHDDIWLQFEAAPGTVADCTWGTARSFPADRDTDFQGRTVFRLPLPGGGGSPGPVTLYLNGSPAPALGGGTVPPLPLQVNSPDLNGDRVVDLRDVVLFAGDIFGAYHLRSDLQRDGAVNLPDIVILARYMGADCR